MKTQMGSLPKTLSEEMSIDISHEDLGRTYRMVWYDWNGMTGMDLEKTLIRFFKLRKTPASQNTVKTIISEKQEITDIHKINSHILNFYKNLFVDRIQ